LNCDRDYLHAAFKAIDETCGSIEAYRRDVLGVETGELDSIRANLLE
jgi:protein tyrosine/serine phosphatase